MRLLNLQQVTQVTGATKSYNPQTHVMTITVGPSQVEFLMNYNFGYTEACGAYHKTTCFTPSSTAVTVDLADGKDPNNSWNRSITGSAQVNNLTTYNVANYMM